MKTKSPRFGSGNDEAVEMANRVTSMAHDYFASKENYRGGTHTTGWWSMANHAVYGRVTGALPSGRLAGEPFTPGLTPHPSASPNLLDNLRDVAQLDPRTLEGFSAQMMGMTQTWSRDRLRWFDLRGQFTRDTAVLIGFARDPGPTRLFRRTGERRYRMIEPEPEYSWTMYRIRIPVTVLPGTQT